MEDDDEEHEEDEESEEDEEDESPGANPPRNNAIYPSFFVHRRLVEDQSGDYWQRCDGWDDGHEVDSRVHFFDRELGFLRAQQDQDIIERNESTRLAFERRRQDPCKRRAHSFTVMRWALFERWVLAEMPQEPYAAFLRECEISPLTLGSRRRRWLSSSPSWTRSAPGPSRPIR